MQLLFFFNTFINALCSSLHLVNQPMRTFTTVTRYITLSNIIIVLDLPQSSIYTFVTSSIISNTTCSLIHNLSN
jgi:hypothetical protein